MSAYFARTFSRQIRTTAFALAAFASAQSFATSASAGLLDFLFGRPQPQQAIVAPPPPIAVKPTRPRIVHDEPRGPRPYVAPEVLPGPLGRFLRDPSLRRGDVVATANGLMVFQGRGGSDNHKASDFAPVATAGGVAAARRSDLINLDRTVRTTTPNVEFVVEKQTTPRTLLIAKRPDGEARGGFIIVPAPDKQAQAEVSTATQ